MGGIHFCRGGLLRELNHIELMMKGLTITQQDE